MEAGAQTRLIGMDVILKRVQFGTPKKNPSKQQLMEKASRGNAERYFWAAGGNSKTEKKGSGGVQN